LPSRVRGTPCRLFLKQDFDLVAVPNLKPRDADTRSYYRVSLLRVRAPGRPTHCTPIDRTTGQTI
jgi:hypothetical protein